MGTSDRLFSRRRLLQTLGIGTASFFMRDVLFARDAKADPAAPPKILIFCYFNGGWDQLLGLDPRPFAYDSADPDAFPNAHSQIDPAWDQILDTPSNVDSENHAKAIAYWVNGPGKASRGLVSLGDTGIKVGPAFYDTVPATDPDVASRLCIVRGVNMGTLTHEVGRRYFITGKFPRGLQAAGSALPTWFTYQSSLAAPQGMGPIPNLSVGVETYNEALPTGSSGLRINSAGDLVNVLQPLSSSLTAPSRAQAARDLALAQFESEDDCWETRLDGDSLVTTLRASRRTALSMIERNLSALFRFSQSTTDPGLRAMYATFGIDPASSSFSTRIKGPQGQALLAARAITPDATTGKPVSNCVSIQLATGIDDHDADWGLTHGANLRGGFDALGRLVRYLTQTDDALVPGKKLIERTQLMAFSEFARTPMVNSRGGRDHHLASSCIVAGGGLRGGVIGGTTDADLSCAPLDLATGQVIAATAPGAYTIRPSDIHASFLQAAGLSYGNLSNQSPQIIGAMLARP